MSFMIVRTIILLLVSLSFTASSDAQMQRTQDKGQPRLSTVLIDKSIQYHDPHNNWPTLNSALHFSTIMADKSERQRDIRINNKEDAFYFVSAYPEGTLKYNVESNIGTTLWNDSPTIPADMAKKYRISNDRAVMYRNYYSYLYGMPMKLKDPGTLVDSFATVVTFHGKTYDRIRVSYDPAVGTDTWYFYFDTETHALEAYQFYKDESKNDGEYILFEELIDIHQIKIPKIRHWYYNRDQKFLATDILVSAN